MKLEISNIYVKFSGMISGVDYPSGINYPSGTGMESFFYPCAFTGNPTDKFSHSGYGYGWPLPVGYIPVAIPKHDTSVRCGVFVFS